MRGNWLSCGSRWWGDTILRSLASNPRKDVEYEDVIVAIDILRASHLIEVTRGEASGGITGLITLHPLIRKYTKDVFVANDPWSTAVVTVAELVSIKVEVKTYGQSQSSPATRLLCPHILHCLQQQDAYEEWLSLIHI